MLLDTISDILPMAAGIALSPIPIAAVVSVLLANDALKASAFLLGWVSGILAIALLVLSLPGLRMLSGDPTPLAGWLRIILAGVLLVVAWRKWQQRPSPEAPVVQPRLLTQIDSYNGWKLLMLGITLSMFNPKSVVLVSAGAMTIYEAKIAGPDMAAAVVVFAAVSSLSVAVPIALSWLRRDRSEEILADVRDWLIAYNSAITISVLVVLALLVAGSGLKIVF